MSIHSGYEAFDLKWEGNYRAFSLKKAVTKHFGVGHAEMKKRNEFLLTPCDKLDGETPLNLAKASDDGLKTVLSLMK